MRTFVSMSFFAAVLAFGLMACSNEVTVLGESPSPSEAVIVREVVLSVPDVVCASCLAAIRKEVIGEPGVVSMGGDATKKIVVLRLSGEAPADDGHLIAAVKRAGFDAEIK